MEVETKIMSKKILLKTLPNLLIVTLSAALAITATALGQQRRNFQGSQNQTSSQSKNGGANSSAAAAQSDAATVFRSARDLITDGEWAKAQARFSEYVSSYPNEKNLDAALY